MATKQSPKSKYRKRRPAERERKKEAVPRLPFSTKNYALFGLGLIVIAVGFITLGRGSITLAPILLILGYCVIVPLAIILK